MPEAGRGTTELGSSIQDGILQWRKCPGNWCLPGGVLLALRVLRACPSTKLPVGVFDFPSLASSVLVLLGLPGLVLALGDDPPEGASVAHGNDAPWLPVITCCLTAGTKKEEDLCRV